MEICCREGWLKSNRDLGGKLGLKAPVQRMVD